MRSTRRGEGDEGEVRSEMLSDVQCMYPYVYPYVCIYISDVNAAMRWPNISEMRSSEGNACTRMYTRFGGELRG